jgi:hypothetical protein
MKLATWNVLQQWADMAGAWATGAKVLPGRFARAA